MSNKLIFRIMGALSASVIIVSLFVPFSMLQSEGLWDIYNNQGMLYIPIVILSFAAFAVISFSLNVKSEFSYISFGACLFYIIVKVIRMNGDGTLGNISLGFYLLVLGTFFTGLMSFLCNLRKKNLSTPEVKNTVENKSEELSISNNSNSTDLFNPDLSLQQNSLSVPSNTVDLQPLNTNMNVFDAPQQIDQTSVGNNNPTGTDNIQGTADIFSTQNMYSAPTYEQVNNNGNDLQQFAQPQNLSAIPNLNFNYENTVSNESVNILQDQNSSFNLPEQQYQPSVNLDNQVLSENTNVVIPTEEPIIQGNLQQNIQMNNVSQPQNLNTVQSSNQLFQNDNLNIVNNNNNLEQVNQNMINQENSTQVMTNAPEPNISNMSPVSNVSESVPDSIPEIVPQQPLNNSQDLTQSSVQQNNTNVDTSADTSTVPNLDIFGI